MPQNVKCPVKCVRIKASLNLQNYKISHTYICYVLEYFIKFNSHI